MSEPEPLKTGGETSIAVIGLAGSFPGAKTIDEFWEHLRAGHETISSFSDDELLEAGVSPETLRNPHYVKARGVLEEVDLFDAEFFGFSAREAEMMNPQHRLFLECSWKALEHAGYDSNRFVGPIGVFAGAGLNLYLLDVCMASAEAQSGALAWQGGLLNWQDSLTTHVSYKMNLRGPSIDVQTFCSTSLVAVHLACQSLLNGECDMALAGGVKVAVPQKSGYMYQEGGIAPPDGHCRAFDAEAKGVASGSGVGVVVLRRLLDALSDRDRVHAIIKGTAINNDGAAKVGFTAPSVDGQARVISEALCLAGAEPESVTYVETHGTGTPLGDTIEIAALTKAFSSSTPKKQFCAIGSVKTNVGHLDAAAGVTGLIKTVLALKHKMIPPSLHFNQPNPEIEFANSPFFVNARLRPWGAANGVRRAGVSSFGIGGTNVHAVLEEAPEAKPTVSQREWQLLSISARTKTVLEAATTNLASHFRHHPELSIVDAAYTLHVGRREFEHRRFVVCRDVADAAEVLQTFDSQRVHTAVQEHRGQPVAFMFPGVGSQYTNMAAGLYRNERVFREEIDRCLEVAKPLLSFDLRDVLFSPESKLEQASSSLTKIVDILPSLFVVEYALARLFMRWGIRPHTMIGHSFGEYVAACLAGVLSLEEMLELVVVRARLMQSVPAGAMLAVPLSAEELKPLLSEDISLAAINAPQMCVISGPSTAIDELEPLLAAGGLETSRLHATTAAHCRMLDPVLDEFRKAVENLSFHPPAIPYISNVTGTWITAEQVAKPDYWVEHLRNTVRFSAGLQELTREGSVILLEVGPGRTLSTLAMRHPASGAVNTICSLRHPLAHDSDTAFLMKTVGDLWLAGVDIDWTAFYADEKPRRVPLPTYPFQHQRYWVGKGGRTPTPPTVEPRQEQDQNVPLSKARIEDWFYVALWEQSRIPVAIADGTQRRSNWLVFDDARGFGEQLAVHLTKRGHQVSRVVQGSQFEAMVGDLYVINPRSPDDYQALCGELHGKGGLPERIVHTWGVSYAGQRTEDAESLNADLNNGFYSLLFLTQALATHNIRGEMRLHVLTSHTQDVSGTEELCPGRVAVLGSCTVTRQEFPHIICRSIDVSLPAPGAWEGQRLYAQLIAELESDSAEPNVAYRGPHRWIQSYKRIRVSEPGRQNNRLRERGVYLITGGLGRVGLAFAGYLARTRQARLALVSRSGLPPREQWERWLASQDDGDATSNKIRSVQLWESLGAEVLVLKADVTDEVQMGEALRQVGHRFGMLHGVIHAVKGQGRASFLIPQMGRAEAQTYFDPKARSAVVLEKVLRGYQLDFCLLMSTISSVLGGLGLSSVAATNLFLDAFACVQNRHSPFPWISVNWDMWRFEENAGQPQSLGKTTAELGMTPEEGTAVLERVLSLDAPSRVVVSTGDLHARMAQWVNLEQQRETKLGETSSVRHPRPQLSNVYVAPKDEVEQAISEIWRELLGYEQIGVYDNFFELGGHSLLATQIITRIRENLHVNLPLRCVFENPTINELSHLAENALIREIENLSDEEAQQLVQQDT